MRSFALNEIPGYAAALQEARRSLTSAREAAWLDLPLAIGGFPVRPMTVADFVLLGRGDRIRAPLDEREREILKLRFGLDRGEPRTLEEVGEHFNLTRERIRQIEARAMSKLRHPSSDTGARDLLSV